MSSIVDIHPHIVSPDTKRYPLAPLGGKQSTWSSERPTTYDMLLKEMDAAGVAKAAIVHSSTAYGYDNSYVADAITAVPKRFTGCFPSTCWRPMPWRRWTIDQLRLHRHAPVHHRQYAAGPGHVVRRRQDLSGLGARGIQRNSGLRADVAARHPLLREIMDRFPKVTIILDHLSRVPFIEGPPYAAAADFLALAKFKQVFLKITPLNVSPENWGWATPETLFGKMIDTFGASHIAWGSNFPNSLGTLSQILGAAKKAFSFAKESDQDWVFGKTAQTLYPSLKD